MPGHRLLYFSAPGCGVCHALWPKLSAMLAEDFPGLPIERVDISAQPLLRGQHLVFTVPVLILLDGAGQERARWARAFSLAEVRAGLARHLAV